MRKISDGRIIIDTEIDTSGATSGTKKLKDTLKQAQSEFSNTTKETQKFQQEMNKLKDILGGEVPEATQKAYSDMAKLRAEIKSASREFGRNSTEATKAKNALNSYALGLDDATFKQVYMRSQLGLTESQLTSQANSIKLNARMVKLMGSQTEILTKQMQGLQDHGIKPSDLLPASTLGQFQMLNETIKASQNPIYKLSGLYRNFGTSMEKSIKGWTAQKMAIKMAGDDMVKYGILLRGITAAQMSLGLAFPIVGLAAVAFYAGMFKGALEADSKLKELAETVKGKLGQAFKPLIDVAGSVLKVILELTGKIADMMIAFDQTHPIISKVVAAIGFLLPAMTLLLLPLASGIGLLNGWKVAINGAWAVIGGVASAVGIAASTFLTFAVIVGTLASGFIYLWKTNEKFRTEATLVLNLLKQIGDSIASVLMPLIPRIVSLITTVLTGITDGFLWVLQHITEISAAVIGLGTAFAVFKGITIILTMVEMFKSLSFAIRGVAIAQGLFNLIMLANPIVLVMSLIAGLVAAVVVLWNTNEGFRNAIMGAWTAIGTLATTVWGGIVTFFTTTLPAAFNAIITFVTSNWQNLLLLLVNPFAGAFALLYSNCDGFKTFIDTFVQDVITFFTTGWASIVTFFTQSVPAWLESMGTWFMELPAKIAYGLGAALGTILQWGVDTWSYLSTNVPLWIEGIGTFFSELPGKIQTWLTNVITNITTWGSSMLTEASTWASNTITGIVNFFTQLPGQILTYLTNCVTNITTWGSNMLTEATTGMTSVFNGIVDTFTNLPSKMLEIGTNIVAGIKQGIKDEWDNMTGWIGGLCKSFTQGVKDNFVIKSPSHIFRDEIGRMLVKGMQVGTELEFPNLQDSMGSNISDLTAQLQASVDYNMARTTANIVGSSNRAAGVSNTSNSTTTNNNAPLFSVEHFHNENNTDIPTIAQELAFYGKRKSIT